MRTCAFVTLVRQTPSAVFLSLCGWLLPSPLLLIGSVFGLYLGDVAVGILGAAGTLYDVGVLESHLFSGCHTEEFLWSVFHKVLAFNPKILGECYRVCSVGLVFRVVYGFHLFKLSIGIVCYYEFDGIEYGRHTDGTLVQIVAHCRLRECGSR